VETAAFSIFRLVRKNTAMIRHSMDRCPAALNSVGSDFPA